MAAGLGPWLLASALTLSLCGAAVTGQVALEQHIREVTVREGDGVTFQCSMSGDRMRSYYMYWYRQEPGGFLEWIYEEDDTYGESFEDRFKGSVESSQNRFTLQIQAAKQGDEAVYFCGATLTLEQLCSRVDPKLTERDQRLLSITGTSRCQQSNRLSVGNLSWSKGSELNIDLKRIPVYHC